MKYLVNANALVDSTKRSPHARVVEWLKRNERDIVVDPIVLGEVGFGILLLPQGRRRRRLEPWFQAGVQIVNPFVGRQVH